MSEIPFLPSPITLPGASIKVIGVGGAGCNAINRMIQSGVDGVQFIAMNTDQQSLAQCKAEIKLPLGPLSMRGLGAGGNADRGAVAAEESRDEILAHLQGADMVFITAGMGGGTGTGAAPIIASCAREFGALTVAVVLSPFRWEGQGKADKALAGLENLRETADTVIVVSNEKLLSWCPKNVTVEEAYHAADGVLIQGVRGISDLILRPGTMNCDFADVDAVLRNGREALIGTGQGRGEEALLDALHKALECPLLERDMAGAATQVMVSVMADWKRIPLSALATAMNFLSDHYHGLPDIKLAQVPAPELEDRVLVTVLASGFEPAAEADRSVDSWRMPDSARLEPNGHLDEFRAPQPARPSPSEAARVYGENASSPSNEVPMPPATPTRLLPQAPTPSGEMGALQDDLHVPAIIRMGQGRLPLE